MLSSLLLGSGCPQSDSDGIELPDWPGQRLDMPFGEHELQALDFYPPANAAERAPLAVFFHSGGFIDGDKRLARSKRTKEFLALSGAGFACAFVNFRLAPEVSYPAPLEDAARAVQMLRSRADELAIDPRRVVFLGYSSGAVLAGTLAYGKDFRDRESDDPVARQSSRCDAWLSEDGPVDFRIFAKQRRVHYFGNERLRDVDPDMVARASPVWLLQQSPRDPVPCFLVYDEAKAKTPVFNPHDPAFGLALFAELRARGDRASVFFDKGDTDRDWTTQIASWFLARFE